MDKQTALAVFDRLESARETELEGDPPSYEVRLIAGTDREGDREHRVRVAGPGWPIGRDGWQYVMETAVEFELGLELDNGAMLLT